MRQLAHLRLAQPGFSQGRNHVVQFGRPLAGAEVAGVVGILAAGYGRVTVTDPNLLQSIEQLLLAVKAAIGMVTCILRNLEFSRLDDANGNSLLLRKQERVGILAARKRWGICDHSQHLRPKSAMSGVSQKSRIHPARVRHQQAAQVFEPRLKGEMLGLQNIIHNHLDCRGCGVRRKSHFFRSVN